MLQLERQNLILSYLEKNRKATTNELSDMLGVSATTIRTDLNQMDKEHLLTKTHGGALYLDHDEGRKDLTSKAYLFNERALENRDEKEMIAKEAAKLVQDHMCIFLDASSTSYTLGLHLTGFTELTVITNGINLALAMKDIPGVTVIMTGGIAKFVAPVEAELGKIIDLKPGTLVLATAGQYATKSVGVLIKTFGAACENHFDKERYEFCWIVDFPMYEIGDESGELEFCHNPFSMPNGGMEVLLKAERGEMDPLDIYANQYDLVCNGVELSSGAVRNHDPEIMIKAFELVRLGEEDVKKKFPAMYNAFCYGAPPHAGIAPGVDRMVMLLAGESSIREIIPFPMNKNAQDIMMGAPSVVEQKQLDELHIAIVGEVEKDD